MVYSRHPHWIVQTTVLFGHNTYCLQRRNQNLAKGVWRRGLKNGKLLWRHFDNVF